MDILIRQLSCRNIRDVTLNSSQISVEFDDGITVEFKDSVDLRMWAVINQNLRYEWIEGDTDHCVVSPLKFYALLGFRSGDAVLFQRKDTGEEQPILFS